MTGSDVYRFARGFGQDTITSSDTTVGKVDAIEFAADVAATDVRLTRSGDNLILSVIGSTDKITVTSYFINDAASAYKLEEIRFADGTIWSIDTVKAMVQAATSGVDYLYGYAGDDIIYSRAGNDTLIGGAGDDKLYGEDGDDTLDGGIGNDTLAGGNGTDIITGGDGVDILDGDAGDDRLEGSTLLASVMLP